LGDWHQNQILNSYFAVALLNFGLTGVKQTMKIWKAMWEGFYVFLNDDVSVSFDNFEDDGVQVVLIKENELVCFISGEKRTQFLSAYQQFSVNKDVQPQEEMGK